MDLKTLIGVNASREFLDALGDLTERSGQSRGRPFVSPSDVAAQEPIPARIGRDPGEPEVRPTPAAATPDEEPNPSF